MVEIKGKMWGGFWLGMLVVLIWNMLAEGFNLPNYLFNIIQFIFIEIELIYFVRLRNGN